MRALVLTGPGHAEVREVEAPTPLAGEVVVDVARAGICGTDLEFFTGQMAYLHSGDATYPLRIGHEWMGTVTALGADVDPAWLGQRVTADTMLGCGTCSRCRTGRQHVCADRTEIGIRGGRPGALAEQIAVPATALISLPDAVDDAMGALVEPGGNAVRAVRAADVQPGQSVLVLGAGTIGLLVAMFARAAGAETVHVVDREPRAVTLARELGFTATVLAELPTTAWDAVIDASTAAQLPATAVQLVEPGGCVAYIGLSASPSLIDTREIVLKDVRATGVLSASGGLTGAVEAYASGRVDPRQLVAATVSLDELVQVLAGQRPVTAGPGPKFHARI